MVKHVLITLLAIGASILTGCGAPGPEKADSVDDIVGTWQRIGGGAEDYCQYTVDGTYVCARTLEEIDRDEGFEGDYWFEGTQYFDQITEDSSCSEVGVYEIHLQPNGNLKFVMISDECRDRISDAVGRGIEEGSIEWQRVAND